MKKILLLATLFIASISNSQSWQNLGTTGIVSPNFLDALSQLTMVISSENVPFVCYTEKDNFGQPTVKRLNGNAWVNVGTSINNDRSASMTSMALDNQNVPYVAYLDYDPVTMSSTANVKKYDGTGWVLVGNPGFATSSAGDIIIKIDNNNIPYVAYNGYGNPENIVVKKLDNNNWVSLGSINASPALNYDFELDNNNKPVIVFTGIVGQDVVLYAKKHNGSSWDDMGLGGFVNNASRSPSLAFDGSNVAHIAFLTGNNPDLNVKKFNGTGWQMVGTTVASTNIDKPKLAIGANNIPVVAYKDLQNNDVVNIKRWVGSNWESITSASSIGQMDSRLSLAVGPTNIPMVVYDVATISEGSVKAKFYGTTLSTHQNEFSAGLKVYPNPSKDFINIDTSSQISKIVITDLLGKIVFETSENIKKIDINNLKTGVYLLKLFTNEGEKTIKISKK